VKGRLFKGSPFTFLKGNVEDKSKLTELTVTISIILRIYLGLTWGQ
jgi:hypothetical protein